MSLSFDQLETAFKARNFQPLYFLYGEEQYLIEQVQRRLVETALAPHERDFNLDLVYGAEADGVQVVAMCSAFPMMAERRVVVVRDFEKLKGNALFQAYAERPNPTAVVLLCCRTKPNLNQHPYRALKASAAWGEFKPLKPREMTGWVTGYLKRLGFRLEPQAAAMLADLVGTDLQTAASEADKLAAHVGTRSDVTPEDILAASGQNRDFNVFELQKAVGDDRFDRAATIAERLLQQAANTRGEALKIVALLASFFAKLHKLSGLVARRASESAMASDVGIPPFVVKEYLQTLGRFPAPRLDAAFAALLAADYELKGGSARDERLVLLLLLRRLLAPSRP